MWLVKGVFPSFDLLFLLELIVEYYSTIGTAGQAICSLALVFLFFLCTRGRVHVRPGTNVAEISDSGGLFLKQA